MIPNLTHLLRCELGEPSLRSYKRQIHEPIDPRVTDYIRTWVEEHATWHS